MGLRRHAFVDERLMAGGFATGDIVRKTGLRDFILSPYVGRVLYSNPEIGKVAVQWPWGDEQDSPTELVKDVSGDFVPPLGVNQSYLTWESDRHTHSESTSKDDEKWRKSLASRVSERHLLHQRLVAKYEQRTIPIWRAACKAWYKGKDEFEAFKIINAAYGEIFGDDAVRLTVANLYGLGRRLALYWKNNKRQYQVTQKEKSTGKVTCPRCKSILKPRVFRQGQKVLSCRTCGFSIHPEDLISGQVPANKVPGNTSM
jgi:ribosomal protein L37AE/L43A